MDCLESIESPSQAYRTLFKVIIRAIPISHYVLAAAIALILLLYNFLEFHFFEDLFTGFRGSRVLLTFNPSSELYEKVASKCRTLHGRYMATPWLSSPHIQSVFINFFGRPPVFKYRREIFHASDGGTFALDWLTSYDVSQDSTTKSSSISKDDTTPIVVVIPGLTSDSGSPYLKHLAYDTAKRGWNVVISNHRGLGGMSVTSDCFYNAGWTEDIRSVVEYLHQAYPAAPLFLIGTSIGANVLVKYLGEDGENVYVAGAVAICSPWDLLIGSRFIGRRLIQKLYDRALTIGLQGYAQLHEPRYTRLANWEGITKSRSIRDFDAHATCLVGNYETVDTYYRHCSCSTFVGRVSVPLLCVGSLDDPLCTTEAVPWDEIRNNKNVVLAMTKHGGHLAFFEGITGSHLWWVRAANEFLGVLHSSPLMHTRKIQSTSHSALVDSSIDQGPYLSAADGMVAAMGTEHSSNNATLFTSAEEHRVHENPESTSEREQRQSTPEANSGDSSSRHANSEDVKSTSPEGITKYLSQLSRHNKNSMWLLAYVAILSSWPLLGTALKFLFRKKFKRGVPSNVNR
ncbi:OLC1v1015477C1 [Oldenlandia corymbosa var. corymbosa]|uniref:OLC1v1015477C1 n=1 Tax=Oldenlandia corymbosa var. corymbosa TaxID=529605 RepID=A0AAV1E376_OLDCO|nr:OLC1v1015477C1 [Oldenlandia corymbosa var. corymbosa]